MKVNKIKDFNIISNEVYRVDPKKENNYVVNNNFHPKGISQIYRILDISRNGTYGPHQKYGAKNGMQAMAVAPENKKGKVDYSHIKKCSCNKLNKKFDRFK
ncbi:hypothetical protein [Lactobacillus sp. PV034]|uniref:hypothetical protein n=1 Tax=Lactobacillus sp. PV034 TaxID=2594495 RepID=UPI0022404265|nr:hypothetical protein [Lactobacillus sp. PV034]QNQ80146.1 hypothetical protein FP432_00555 [Lactobacillus sp. PV034]